MKKIIILLLFYLTITTTNGTNNIHRNDSTTIGFLDSIKCYLDNLNVEEPIYVMAQAAYESGWFECKSCSWKYNNMFGFKAQNGKYLKFKTWKDCLIYYSIWQNKNYPIYKKKHPKGTYLEFLKYCKYSESPEYFKHITSVYNWIVDNWASDSED